jgi:beta-xylosidase
MTYAYDAAILLLTRIEGVSEVNGDGDLEIDRAELAQAVRLTDGFPGITGDLTLNPFGDRLDTIVTWQDHFNLPTLADEWSWVREDPALWSLTERPGFLRLMTHQGALGNSDNLSKNLLVQKAPLGDFTLAAKMDFDPSENYQLAGLLLYLNDDNYMLFGRAFCENPGVCVGNGIYFDFINDGEWTGGNFATTTDISPQYTYLALQKDGAEYTGWISPDGINWEAVGTHTADFHFDMVGLGTTNGNQPTDGAPADFDYFLLQDDTNHLFLPSIAKP